MVKPAEIRLITAALPYINNIPHLGHIVGSHLPADIFARFCRLKGYKTLFVGGTDENGTPSLLAAKEIKIPLERFSSTIFKEHKKIYDWFNISYDNFSRTSKKIHHETTQEFFNEIYKNKFIIEGRVKQFYDEKEKMFLPDRYVNGKCGYCGYEHARGDQCEKCTRTLDAFTLKDPISTISKTKPIIKESGHLFLDLKKISPKLESWLKKQKHWRHQVLNLALSWIKEGLKERCITRDLKNGVPVPLKEYKDKVFYVWFDAPIGYISSTKEHTKDWRKYWQNKNSKIYHFIGKDNIPFHTIFWPASLIANGTYNLPFNVVGLQYLNYEGGKFSKTHKRGIFCGSLPSSNINPDILRAYLTFVIPETGDTEFKWSEFESRINSDLIGNFGNFINRILTFAYNKLDGNITKPKTLTKEDKIFQNEINDKISKIDSLLEKLELRHAFHEILLLSDLGNKYFNDQEPWIVLKENKKRAEDIIYLCVNLCKSLAIVSYPYMPSTSERIFKFLNLKNIAWDFSKEIKKINKPEILFSKLEPDFLNEFKKLTSKATNLKDLFKN